MTVINYYTIYDLRPMCADYMAPEIVTKGGHDVAVDNWALGVLLFEMLTGRSPFRQAPRSNNNSSAPSRGTRTKGSFIDGTRMSFSQYFGTGDSASSFSAADSNSGTPAASRQGSYKGGALSDPGTMGMFGNVMRTNVSAVTTLLDN